MNGSKPWTWEKYIKQTQWIHKIWKQAKQLTKFVTLNLFPEKQKFQPNHCNCEFSILVHYSYFCPFLTLQDCKVFDKLPSVLGEHLISMNIPLRINKYFMPNFKKFTYIMFIHKCKILPTLMMYEFS
jgi:hypothetical protein